MKEGNVVVGTCYTCEYISYTCKHISDCRDEKRLNELKNKGVFSRELDDLINQREELCTTPSHTFCSHYPNLEREAEERAERVRYDYEHPIDARGCI